VSDVADDLYPCLSCRPFRFDPGIDSHNGPVLPHQATISVAVMDATGKVVMESILETKAATIVEFFAGLRGTLSVTFEEGTWSGWLYDLHPRTSR